MRKTETKKSHSSVPRNAMAILWNWLAVFFFFINTTNWRNSIIATKSNMLIKRSQNIHWIYAFPWFSSAFRMPLALVFVNDLNLFLICFRSINIKIICGLKWFNPCATKVCWLCFYFWFDVFVFSRHQNLNTFETMKKKEKNSIKLAHICFTNKSQSRLKPKPKNVLHFSWWKLIETMNFLLNKEKKSFPQSKQISTVWTNRDATFLSVKKKTRNLSSNWILLSKSYHASSPEKFQCESVWKVNRYGWQRKLHRFKQTEWHTSI